jgi:glutamyl-tRNA(Gln) amidotransferase subunit D
MYSKEVQKLLNKLKTEVGDRIQIIKDKKTFEGILMPRIEMGDLNSIVLKLDNGYNIGIKFEKGVKINKIKKEWSIRKKKIEPSKKLIFDKKLPNISIIGTGGTIASKIDYRSGGVYASFSPDDIVMQIPELKEIANIQTNEIMNIMSEDMTPEKWIDIAKAVAKEINSGVKGVLITHGTDTLHYTSAALSFMLRDLPVPVALVGAQRSSDRGSSDTVMNIACAANFVANSNVAEICTVMHGTMNDDYCLAVRGTKSRKMHTSRRDAFRPINELPIAKIFWKDRHIEITNDDYRRRNDKKVLVDDKIESKVALVKIYPGLDPEIFDYYLKKKYRGFVIEGTGLGHVSTFGEKSLLSSIEKIIELGIPAVMTSQCIYGRVHPFVYHPLRVLSSKGVIYAEDMLSETAYVKLMWVLGHAKKLDEIKKMMLTNYAGEITNRVISNSFLI